MARSPIKRIPKEKSETATLEQLVKTTDKLSIIITGNGNPKDGYMYKVDEMGRDVKEINNKLTGISGIVKELHEESIGKKKVEKTDAEKRIKWLQIGMFIVAIIALLYTAINTRENIKVSKGNTKKIENLGEPIIIDKEGQIKDSRGVEIKMFGKKDTVK
jgi:hypothetical protein